MAAERELLEISEDKLVSFYLHDLLLSHCVPSFRTISWHAGVARHGHRSIFHAPQVHGQVHEKDFVRLTFSQRGMQELPVIVMEIKSTGSGKDYLLQKL